MDTEAVGTVADPAAEGIALIKARMPETYRAIQARGDLVGKVAFALVRRAFRGEPNCFWAVEGGYVVGTPFNDLEVQRDVAQGMAQLGTTHLVLWGPEAWLGLVGGGGHGAN